MVLGAMVTIENLKTGLKIAKKHKVHMLELPWEPLMEVKPETLAPILKTFGIREIAICCFFGKGGIDPLSMAGREPALQSLERAAIFADKLRSLGIRVSGIGGPWAYQIAKKYKRDGIKKRLVSFCKEVAKISGKYDVVFFLECLREAENTAMRGSYELLEVLEAVDEWRYVRAHLDTFHMQLWGENINQVLEKFGLWLEWFHCSGTERRTPGKRGDTIIWENVADALDWNHEKGGALSCICFEGFCPEFRRLVPEIGDEFPEDLTPGRSIALAQKTLRKAGII